MTFKEDGSAVVAAARMATAAPKEFVINTYRLDYSFTVFAYDPDEQITPDSIKNISFYIKPECYGYHEDKNGNKCYGDDTIVSTLIEASKSSAIFSGSLVITCDNIRQNWTKTWLNDKQLKIVPTEKLNFSKIYNIRMSDSLRAVDNSLINQFVPLNVQCFYYEGKGTDDEPFEVTNAEQLDRIRNFLDKSFILKNDIDFAGIVSHVVSSTVTHCENKGLINGGLSGVVGRAYDNSLIEFCINSNSIYLYSDLGESTRDGLPNDVGAGGVVGGIYSSTIQNCKNTGDVKIGPEETGGIDLNNIGGISGFAEDDSTVKDCSNSGMIGTESGSNSSIENCGGIVGNVNDSTIQNCNNSGAIHAEIDNGSISKYFGGIAGYLDLSQVSNCENTGNIKAYEYVGGIAGVKTNSSTIEESTNAGTITGNYNTGEIYGAE